MLEVMRGCVVALVLVCLLVALVSLAAAQPARAQWVMKDCFTLEAVTDFLNTLPPDRAADAKVVAINSQRSFMGSLSTPYYVWYRR